MADTISFARGAPSLDIVDVDGLKAAADARVRATTRAARPPTARRSATCRCGAGSPSSTASSEAQVLVTNGSMQADAFLFDELVSAGDAVVVEKPTYDRTLLGLQAARRRRPHGRAAARRHRRRRAARRCSTAACSRRSRTSSPTSRTPPATRCRCAKRERAARARRASTASRSSRTTRTSTSASAASRCRRCCRWTTARRASSTRRRSPRPSAPASASATSSAPRS